MEALTGILLVSLVAFILKQSYSDSPGKNLNPDEFVDGYLSVFGSTNADVHSYPQEVKRVKNSIL